MFREDSFNACENPLEPLEFCRLHLTVRAILTLLR